MATAVAAVETTPAPVASPDRKPSGKQVYFIARLALEAMGATFPGSSADASELIQRLQKVARPAEGASDDCPF